MPLYRRLPKRGFKNIFKKIQNINFNTIKNIINKHKVDPVILKKLTYLKKNILKIIW